MPSQDQSRRLSPTLISDDENAYAGFLTIANYQTTRADANKETITAAREAMRTAKDEEIRLQTLAAAAADDTRLKEWKFHNHILAMRDVVKGQFGADSPEIQAVGLRKKSEHKRPRLRAAAAAAAPPSA